MNRNVQFFSLRAIIPPIKCDLEGGEKANPLSNVNPAFSQCSVFLAASYLISRRCRPHHLSRATLHEAMQPCLCHYKCDSHMYKLARNICVEDRRSARRGRDYITAHLITHIFFAWFLFFSCHIRVFLALKLCRRWHQHSLPIELQNAEFFLLQIARLQLRILAVKFTWPPAGNPWKIATPVQLLFLLGISERTAGLAWIEPSG